MAERRVSSTKSVNNVEVKQDKASSNQHALEELDTQFSQYCSSDLGLDDKTKCDALELFKRTRSLLVASNGALGAGTEDEMLRSWSACIIYCASRLNRPISADGDIAEHRNTRFTLSKLLTVTKFGVWDFFRELPQFLLKADTILRSLHGEACDNLSQQVKELQANFVHLTVLFNYYKRNFQTFFLDEESSKGSSSGYSDHLKFGWMLFLALRMHVLSQFTDLVTCTNGLVSIMVIMVVHMPIRLRNFSLTLSVKGPDGVKVIKSLCNLYNASEDDVCTMVNKANNMISEILQVKHDAESCGEELKEFDSSGVVYFKGLLEEPLLSQNLNILDTDYEDMYYKQGELDERVFLYERDSIESEFDKKEIALTSNSETTVVKASSFQSLPGSPFPSLSKPANGMMLPPTPVTITMTTAKWFRTVISPLPPEPSPELIHFFKSCDTDITSEITHRAQILLEAVFPCELRGSWGLLGGCQGYNATMDNVWAEQRRLEAVKLYYKVLGAMCKAESQRLHCKNLSPLLTNERFHRCMLACSAELVLATHKTVTMIFPAVLERAGITAFDLTKVIESFVRHEETLPRELKRHLNAIEEKLLEKLAWEKGSSLYNALIVAKPNLQSEVNRLALLADPMPSLDTINFYHWNGAAKLQTSDSQVEISSGEINGNLSPQRQIATSSTPLPTTVTSIPGSTDISSSALLSPVRERPSAFSAFHSGKTRVQPPLQSVFASPQRPSIAGTGETCAETAVNVFFQKVLKLAAIRIKALCVSLKQPNHVMEEVYKMVQYILYQETHLFFNRHIDQIILCSIYGVCKVNGLNLTFKEIVQHYKLQPQNKPHVFRTVFINLPAAKQIGKGGQETGDIIRFYNEVFVPTTKGFLVQLSSNVARVGPTQTSTKDNGEKIDGHLPGSPGPSPFQSLPDMSPKRVSANHNVYVSPLRSSKMDSLLSPHARSLYACVGESTHAYQSPSKDLTEINNRVNNRRLGRLEFGAVGLVSDSLVARSLYPCDVAVAENSTHLTSDSVLSQSQSLSWSNSTPPRPSPSKRPCLDR